MPDVDDRLLQLFKKEAVLQGEFVLASGMKASFYFDGRMVTLSAEGAYLVGKRLLEIAVQAGAEAVGGMTMGADPMAAAASVMSYQEGKPLSAFIVRPDSKGHGTQKRVEGPLRKGSRVMIVDDVVTTGGSILGAIEAVEAEKCTVVKVVALLDRCQGGSDEIRRRGYDFAALLVSDASGEVMLPE
ncbi:MAG: orotate phosphoribosyltransferase [Dehalococcoidia bacterium]|nr:orotate phosphoribosyltransferase [Dehalococcoidia bacterium]